MYEPLVLFYVGVVLFLNGLWMLERIGDREIVLINALVGFLFLGVAFRHAFGSDADATSVHAATLSLMFAFTYLWVAYNVNMGCDGRGLGWFSLMVALTAEWESIRLWAMAGADPWLLWGAFSWTAWALLWLFFFFLQVMKWPLTRATGWMAVTQGLVTGWLPALLMLRP